MLNALMKYLSIAGVFYISCGSGNHSKNSSSGIDSSNNSIDSSSNEKERECKAIVDDFSKLTIYKTYDSRPAFYGGDLALIKFVNTHFDFEENEPYQGTFSVSCIIDSAGVLKFPRIRDKSVKDYTGGEKELIRVFSKMPKWIPGKCNKQNVSCMITVPVIF
ncbi:MAG: hypothetical protein J7621_10290 [Niastella sp.]|nr:hypothetical protein [Niastella sp.]